MRSRFAQSDVHEREDPDDSCEEDFADRDFRS
jgi:hypothetical protein